MIETVLNWFALYGVAVLFIAILAGQTGVIPVPTTIILLTVGALLEDGSVNPLYVLITSVFGAVLGDQFGYTVGRMGGLTLLSRIEATRWGPMIERAERYSSKWGSFGVFFSRWLVSPVGPYVNYLVGMTKMPWLRFSLMSVAGEIVWIAGCLGLGYGFSASIPSIDALLANMTWFVGALIATVFLGLRVKRSFTRFKNR